MFAEHNSTAAAADGVSRVDRVVRAHIGSNAILDCVVKKGSQFGMVSQSERGALHCKFMDSPDPCIFLIVFLVWLAFQCTNTASRTGPTGARCHGVGFGYHPRPIFYILPDN